MDKKKDIATMAVLSAVKGAVIGGFASGGTPEGMAIGALVNAGINTGLATAVYDFALKGQYVEIIKSMCNAKGLSKTSTELFVARMVRKYEVYKQNDSKQEEAKAYQKALDEAIATLNSRDLNQDQDVNIDGVKATPSFASLTIGNGILGIPAGAVASGLTGAGVGFAVNGGMALIEKVTGISDRVILNDNINELLDHYDIQDKGKRKELRTSAVSHMKEAKKSDSKRLSKYACGSALLNTYEEIKGASKE